MKSRNIVTGLPLEVILLDPFTFHSIISLMMTSRKWFVLTPGGVKPIGWTDDSARLLGKEKTNGTM